MEFTKFISKTHVIQSTCQGIQQAA